MRRRGVDIPTKQAWYSYNIVVAAVVVGVHTRTIHQK